jgi:hypothetical protein
MSSLAPLTAHLSAPVAATGLPVVDEARGVGGVPNYVRDGSTAVKQGYATAQGFEEMLLQQLSQSLAQSSGLSGEGEGSEGSGEAGSPEGGGEAGGGVLSALLPPTLTESVMREGGLGLATQLMSALDPSAVASASAGSTGGVSAPAGAARGTPAAARSANGVAAPTGGVAAGESAPDASVGVAQGTAGHTGGAAA